MMKSVLYDVARLCEQSQERYGDFASTHEALGVALEEWDELRAALHDNNLIAIRNEAIDLAAVLVRLAVACDYTAEYSAFQERSLK
jgi:hypothetical protein